MNEIVIVLLAFIAGGSLAVVIGLIFINKVLLEIRNEVAFLRFMRENEKR